MVGYECPLARRRNAALKQFLKVAIMAQAACGGTPPAKLVANRPPSGSGIWTFSAEAAGPILADTVITTAWLERTFGRVQQEQDRKTGEHRDFPVTRGTEGGAHWWFEVRDGDDLLLAVVVDSNCGLVTRVSATSARIRVAGHSWRVDEPLADANGLECACQDSIKCHVSGNDYLEIDLEATKADTCLTRGSAYLGRKIDRINWLPHRPALPDSPSKKSSASLCPPSRG